LRHGIEAGSRVLPFGAILGPPPQESSPCLVPPKRWMTRPNLPRKCRRRQGWQKHYFRGTSPANTRAREHQSKLSLQNFVEEKSNKPPTP
jgi:hypothetical protein